MQTKDATTLIAAAQAGNWAPIVDNITIFSDYPARTLARNFSQIPILIGNNDDESTLFLVQQELQNQSFPASDISTGNVQKFTCPAGARANASVAANLATWRYRYFGEFPNTMLTSSPDSGAYHGSEVPVIFDTLPQPGNGIPASTAEEVAIGKYIRGAWAAFAKNSTGGLLAYEGGWPAYQPGSETLIRLGYNNLTGTNTVLPAAYDVGCTVTFPINAANPTTSPSPTSTPHSSAACGLVMNLWGLGTLLMLTLL